MQRSNLLRERKPKKKRKGGYSRETRQESSVIVQNGMKEEKVFIPSTGIQLEGLLSIQEASSFRGGVILCHPHPQYGGDMDHPVITTAVEAASQEGFSTLRFNFRGVGESEGSYGEGIGEREDVKAVTDYLYSRLKRQPFSPHSLRILFWGVGRFSYCD